MAVRSADAPDRGATISKALDRVRGEFLEMPGLRLTPAQARRLWHLDATTCDTVLDRLVSAGFLACDATHQYARQTPPERRMAKAALGTSPRRIGRA